MFFKPAYGLSCLIVVAWLAGCAAGGSEAGNPSALRGVQGQLDPGQPLALSQSAVTDTCVADAVVAVDSEGGQIKQLLDDTCSFRIDLPADAAYRFLILAGDVTLAVMQFHNDRALFPAPVMIISPDFDDIDLGSIRWGGGVAVPGIEPAKQNDIDGDGIRDFDDGDDDNDGIVDSEESDCDLDGIIDDFDNDQTGCNEETNFQTAKIKEVFPRNGSGFTDDTEAVAPDTEIMVRLNCSILEASVSGNTFHVWTLGETVDCDYVIESGSNEIECRPREDLLPATIYSVTIDGVRCHDGRRVEARSWSWRTSD